MKISIEEEEFCAEGFFSFERRIFSCRGSFLFG